MTAKSCINLLPWREIRYAQQCYVLYRNTGIILLILLVMLGNYWYFSERLNRHIQEQQKQLEQLKHQLTNRVQETKQLQKDYSQ